MVQLFLSEPEWERGSGGDGELGKMWMGHLGKLESALWSLMMSGGRSEARMWLSTAISGIGSLSPRHQVEVFVKLLRSRPTNRGLAARLLRMIFERRPQMAGGILAKRSSVFEKFFDGHPRRILQWFSHFAIGGGMEHKRGAKSLSQFAFLNRDICWEELNWKGKHGQSPVVVATKPYYLLDLDVQRTIENFIDNVPEFWSSSEFAESLKDGDIISVDTKFFEDFFLGLMYKDDAKDVWVVIGEFLTEESFSSLCHHLLITLEETEFCTFLQLLGMYVKPRKEPNDVAGTMYWLELLISRSYATVDELLLINAVINQGRKLLRLMHDEEFEDERDKIKESLSQISTLSCNVNNLVPLLNECVRSKLEKATKLLGLQSWVLHCALAEEYRSPQSWESVLSMNRLSFKTSDEYEMLDDNGLVEEIDPSDDEASKKRKPRKKKKSRRKRRRDFDEEDNDNDQLEFGTLSKRLDRSWLLSTDGYSASWTSADLPEHLAKFCFCVWMKWANSRIPTRMELLHGFVDEIVCDCHIKSEVLQEELALMPQASQQKLFKVELATKFLKMEASM